MIAHRNAALRKARGRLTITVAALALIGLPLSPVHGQLVPTAATAPVEDSNRYYLQLMMQIFDGKREFAHSQVAGFGRMRQGNESWVMLDFGGGAVVIEEAGETAASGFLNTTGIETGMRYDYATKTLSDGDPSVAAFHNDFVRPQLGRAPALGANAAWTSALTTAQLGFSSLGDAGFKIELRREYFRHEGKDFVLLHYQVPSFTYRSDGRTIVHWGEGVALTDRSFGQVYWNAMLHRAVANGGTAAMRPYHFTKTLAALDDQGQPLLDPRAIPQIAPHFARLYGAAAPQVMGFVDDSVAADQTPINVAAKIDIMALSLAEDSANQLGEVTSSYLQGLRGDETPLPIPTEEATDEEPGPVSRAMRNATLTLENVGEAVESALRTEIDKAPPNLTAPAADILRESNAIKVANANLAAPGVLAEMERQAALSSRVSGGLDGALERTRSGREAQDTAASPANQQELAAAASALEGEAGKAWRSAKSYENAAREAYANAVTRNDTAAQQAAQDAIANAQAQQDRALRYDNYARDAVFQPGKALQLQDPSAAERQFAGGGGGGAGGGIGGGGGGSASGLEKAANAGNALGDGVDTGDKVADAAAGVQEVARRAGALSEELTQARREYDAAKAAFKALPQSEAVTATLKPSVLTMKSELIWMNKELQQFEIYFDTVLSSKSAPDPKPIQDYIALQARANAMKEELKSLYISGEAWDWRPSDKAKSLLGVLTAKAHSVKALEKRTSAFGEYAAAIARQVQALSDTDYGKLTAKLGGAGMTVLGRTADALNVASIGGAGYNVYSTVKARGHGELPLSRDYGQGSMAMLGLELAGLWGNIVTGNVAGFFLDATTTVTTSMSDILIANYGLTQTFKAMDDAEWTRIQLETDRRIQNFYAKRGEIEKLIKEAKLELEELDEELDGSKLAKEILEERKRKRAETEAEAKRQAAEAKREADKQIAAARAENERRYREQLKRPPTAAEWAKFNRDIAEAMKPDYPTAPPLTAAQIAERLARVAAKQRDEAARSGNAAAEAARAAAKLLADKREAERRLAEAQANAVARREAERVAQRDRRARQRDSGLDVSGFNITPVTFNPPKWTPPKWTPPKWVPPQFTPPDPSKLPLRTIGKAWPGQTGNLASLFPGGDMSGVVATDLSRWSEWLKTQNVRELERLARNAGYPNLAAALADAGNLLRASQDEGYRNWALQQPSCGGYVGCGPSFLERWAEKSSKVALGDILNASRAIFSTGGFSDIGISGLDLAYMLRDFGIQDGDIINIKISQFGRTIFTNNNFTLTTAGNNFNIALRPGVASLEIFAVNEGTARPNTAEITIQNVTEGQARQQYSLSTGQFATLRIATKRPKRN